MRFFRPMRPAACLLAGVTCLVLVTAPVHAQQAAKPASSAAAPVAASSSSTVSVNGQVISPEELDIIGQDLGPNLPPQATPAQKQDYISNFAINLYLAASEAEKEKLGNPADMEMKLAYYRRRILMEALMTKVASQAATGEAVKKTYEEAIKKIPPQDEVHARHILLENEADAKKAYERIKAGEDFAKLAKELSKDPGASNGGDLGWFTKERMVKEFADAAFALKPGEVSQPVKSEFGWHIIKLEERRQKSAPALEQVKPQITNYLQQQAQQDLITRLRSSAKIVQPPAPAESPAANQPGEAAPAPVQ